MKNISKLKEELLEALRIRRCTLLAPSLGRIVASVAILVREFGGGLQLLYLLRTQRRGDPWSGHISFPGGKIEMSDDGPREAAIRETLEETSLDLTQENFVCRLDDQITNYKRVNVAAFVFTVSNTISISFNQEISAGFWISLTDLMDRKRYIRTVVSGEWGKQEVPAIDLLDGEGPALWGLTYRFTSQILACVNHPLPGGAAVHI